APTPVPRIEALPPSEPQPRNGSPLPPGYSPVQTPVVHPITPPKVREVRGERIEILLNDDFISGPPGRYRAAAPPVVQRTIGPDGLERIGVDFSHTVTPASGSVPVTGTVQGSTGESIDSLMKCYRVACAAGRKDEASRLALQLLAKDPTCFYHVK
ncbi:unnamed protein product, partial [marine sediment metagenome]